VAACSQSSISEEEEEAEEEKGEKSFPRSFSYFTQRLN